MTVVTWQTPSGDKLDVCSACEDRLDMSRSWPRNNRGEEYCQVSHGVHEGNCDICEPQHV